MRPWLRYPLCLVLIGISVAAWFGGGGMRAAVWPAAIGIVLFMFGGPSQSEKNGYRF